MQPSPEPAIEGLNWREKARTTYYVMREIENITQGALDTTHWLAPMPPDS